MSEAVERVRAGAFTEEDTGVELLPLEEDLARVLQRLGRYRRAADHWKAALKIAVERKDSARAADLHRRIGQAAYLPGRYQEAVSSYTEGLEYAKAAGDRSIEAHLHLYKGVALQAQGSAVEARSEMETALAVAETVADPSLLARVRRELMILHIWLGDPDEAREQGQEAIALSEEAGDLQITFWVYWALAILEGFLGEVEVMDRHIQRCREIAKELRSPVLELWTSEVLLEHAMAAGEWNTGIALGERAVARARVLGQDALLPRLLVWLSLIYLGRGEIERGRACVDEAWTLSGAATGDNSRVHLVVPAHIGKAAYHHAAGEYEEAIRVGEAGLAIAENTGFIIWAAYRLLPLIGEAYLQIHDAEAGLHIEKRMRRYGKKTGARVGLAWLDAYEAIKVWYSGDIERATVLLRKAAEELEAVPMIYDAARLRRQLAGRLADLGDRDAALEQLRRVHEVFQRIGAEPELKKTRGMFRELDTRPPSISKSSGAEALSQRELEIARLVARRKSNKTIAKELGISPRTVSTHLSNTFQKLEIGSRGELADYAREHSLLSSEAGD